MAKLYVILSTNVKEKHLASITADDVVLVGPNVELPIKLPTAVRSTIHDFELEQNACDQIATELQKLKTKSIYKTVTPFINDFYSYTLRPIIRVYGSVVRVIREVRPKEIVLISAKKRDSSLPLYGFQTTELRKGSPQLLGATTARILEQVLEQSFNGIRVRRIHTPRDPLCWYHIRRAVFKSANLIFAVKFTALCIATIISLKKSSPIRQSAHIMFLVRNEHQARFFSKLARCNQDCRARVIYIPQIAQGTFSKQRDLLKKLSSHSHIFTYRMQNVVAAWKETIKEIIAEKRRTKNNRNCRRTIKIRLGNGSINIALSDLVSEIFLMWSVFLYKHLLKQIVIRQQQSQLVNFELVGRFAGLDWLVASSLKKRLLTVQTALVSKMPIVVFPYANVFLADGPSTSRDIANNGSLQFGAVTYWGTPHELKPIRNVERFEKVAFFTQPYEPAANCEIILSLIYWCKASGAALTIKPHPRDDINRYLPFQDAHQDVVINIERNATADELLLKNDLCVTRTSSVAKEAFALGVPVILCLWTEFDRMVRADYISVKEKLKYRSHCKKDLIQLLEEPGAVYEAACTIREELFAGKGIRELASKIFREKE